MTQDETRDRFEDDLSSMVQTIADLNRWTMQGALKGGFSRSRQMDMQQAVKRLGVLVDRALAA